MRGQRVVPYRIYSYHFPGSTHFYFTKAGRGKLGLGGGGWGLTGTPIDMSSFYLPNEFFFPSELRRHTEKTLHYGRPPLADAKPRDERIMGSTYRIYSCHFPGSTHFYFFYKIREKEDGVGGWGFTGTPIDMYSFYLLNELFLFSELRCHLETTLHHGVSPLANENVQQNHLHDNKCKKIIRSEHII